MFWATADGTAVANTTTETIIFPNVTVPGNYMQDGRALRLYAFGELSTTATPTIQFALRWGGVAGTLLAQSDAITNGSGVTKTTWRMMLLIQTRANGSSGSLFVMGKATVMTAAAAATSSVFGSATSNTPVAVTVDLTADTALSLTAKWSAASASNSLTGHMYHGESLT